MSTKKIETDVPNRTTAAGPRGDVDADDDEGMVGFSVELSPRMKGALEELKKLTGRAMGRHVRDALNAYLTSDGLKAERQRYLDLKRQGDQIGR